MSRYQFTHKLTACLDHNHAWVIQVSRLKTQKESLQENLWMGVFPTFQGRDFRKKIEESITESQPLTVGDWWIY